MNEEGEGESTWFKAILDFNMDEENVVIFQSQFLKSPFHGRLAVFVFVDSHRRRYSALLVHICHYFILFYDALAERRWHWTAAAVVAACALPAMHADRRINFGSLSEIYEIIFVFLLNFLTIFGLGVLLLTNLWCSIRYGIILIYSLLLLCNFEYDHKLY